MLENSKRVKDSEFAKRVYDLVNQIPYGRVMTYGQIAAICGSAKAARIVGGIAHYGPTDLPWHRVVSKNGGLAAGYYGGREGHKKDLQLEGIKVTGRDGFYTIDIDSLIWSPNED